MERQAVYKCAGDSGYAISQIVVKLYTSAEDSHDPRKYLFNTIISGMSTIKIENIFGKWKRRFPILSELRTKLILSQKIILATTILHNIKTMWNEELPEGEGGDDDNDGDDGEPKDDDDPDPDVRVQYALN